jgi:hypothetical protein
MDPDPSRRFPTALAFASALESAARGETLTGDAAAAPVMAAAGIAGTGATAGGETETVEDDEEDIATERDEDVAHHALIMREHHSDPATIEDEALEDPEAEADRMMLDAAAVASDAPAATSEEPFARRDTLPPAATGRAGVSSGPEYPYAPAIVPDRRSRVLPMAAMLALGLLAGFAVGYGVGARDPGEEEIRARASQSDTAAERQPAGAPYSEQAVTPRADAAPDPAVPAPAATSDPSVPAEAPAEGPAAAAAPRTTGRLVVDSIPPRAGVMVNGRWRGRTPLNLDQLTFGKHTLRVVQPGYLPSDQSFTVSANDPIEVLSVRLQRQDAARPPQPAPRPSTPAARTPAAPARSAGSGTQSFTGSIYVDSRPRGARVLIDGRPVGTTPLSVPDVRIGAHVIRLELPEHRPWSASTRVAAGETARVTGSLERIQ